MNQNYIAGGEKECGSGKRSANVNEKRGKKDKEEGDEKERGMRERGRGTKM
jgi:hypothetical protein